MKRLWYHHSLNYTLSNKFVKMATIKIEIPHNPLVKNSNVFL